MIKDTMNFCAEHGQISKATCRWCKQDAERADDKLKIKKLRKALACAIDEAGMGGSRELPDWIAELLEEKK